MKTKIMLVLISFLGMNCTKAEQPKPAIKEHKIRLVISARNVELCEWGTHTVDKCEITNYIKRKPTVNLDTTFYLPSDYNICVNLAVKFYPEYKLEDYVKIYKDGVLERHSKGKLNYQISHVVK